MSAIATTVLISKTAGPDLFDLIPANSHSEGYLLLRWAALERTHHALNAGEIASGTIIRALGYMMDGNRPVRDGERVRTFVLLPDKGNALHLAHRFGDVDHFLEDALRSAIVRKMERRKNGRTSADPIPDL